MNKIIDILVYFFIRYIYSNLAGPQRQAIDQYVFAKKVHF